MTKLLKLVIDHVVQEHEDGVPIEKISERYGLTPEMVEKIIRRKSKKYSFKVDDEHCKDCVFKLNPKSTKGDKLLCPFVRCIHKYGWKADEKESVSK